MAVDRAEADARPLRAAGRRFRDRFDTRLATVRGGSLFSTARSGPSGTYASSTVHIELSICYCFVMLRNDAEYRYGTCIQACSRAAHHLWD